MRVPLPRQRLLTLLLTKLKPRTGVATYLRNGSG